MIPKKKERNQVSEVCDGPRSLDKAFLVVEDFEQLLKCLDWWYQDAAKVWESLRNGTVILITTSYLQSSFNLPATRPAKQKPTASFQLLPVEASIPTLKAMPTIGRTVIWTKRSSDEDRSELKKATREGFEIPYMRAIKTYKATLTPGKWSEPAIFSRKGDVQTFRFCLQAHASREAPAKIVITPKYQIGYHQLEDNTLVDDKIQSSSVAFLWITTNKDPIVSIQGRLDYPRRHGTKKKKLSSL